jgi:hypothetical protein
MNAETKVKPADGLAKLREKFEPHQISKLPKPFKRDSAKGKCKPKSQGGDAPDWQDHFCGGYHGLPAVHLDYVGHAALTDRLLDVDPEWSWEPMGTTPEGLPAMNGGLWIKLTVCGVSRYGFGSADGKSGGDAVKEMIGDALRNAAMRFGAALELWHKGDLRADEELEDKPKAKGPPANDPNGGNGKDAPFPQGPAKNKTELKAMCRNLWRDVEGSGDTDELEILLASKETTAVVAQMMKALPHWWDGGTDAKGETFEGLEAVIARKRRDFEQL